MSYDIPELSDMVSNACSNERANIMQFNRDDLLALTAIILLFVILSLPGDWVLALRDWLKALINLPSRPPSPSWFPTDKVVHVFLFLATALPVTIAIHHRVSQRLKPAVNLHDINHGVSREISHDSGSVQHPANKRRLRLTQVGSTAFIVMLILGVLSEWIQSFIPGRSADPLDLVADLLGSLLGIALAQLFIKRSGR